jgi:hypothetical protein
MTQTTPEAKSKPAAPAEPRLSQAFVDGVEAGVARLLLKDEQGEWRTFHLPVTALPKDAHEGGWLELAVRSIAPPPEADARALREQLGRGDSGGNFAL